jgi:hypothetical protein
VQREKFHLTKRRVKEKRHRETGASVESFSGDVGLLPSAAVAATAVFPTFTTLAAATAALGILAALTSWTALGGAVAADRLAHLNEPLLSILL